MAISILSLFSISFFLISSVVIFFSWSVPCQPLKERVLCVTLVVDKGLCCKSFVGLIRHNHIGFSSLISQLFTTISLCSRKVSMSFIKASPLWFASMYVVMLIYLSEGFKCPSPIALNLIFLHPRKENSGGYTKCIAD